MRKKWLLPSHVTPLLVLEMWMKEDIFLLLLLYLGRMDTVFVEHLDIFQALIRCFLSCYYVTKSWLQSQFCYYSCDLLKFFNLSDPQFL